MCPERKARKIMQNKLITNYGVWGCAAQLLSGDFCNTNTDTHTHSQPGNPRDCRYTRRDFGGCNRQLPVRLSHESPSRAPPLISVIKSAPHESTLKRRDGQPPRRHTERKKTVLNVVDIGNFLLKNKVTRNENKNSHIEYVFF